MQRVRILRGVHEPLHPKRIPGSLYAIKWVSNTEVFAFGQACTTKSVACNLRNIFFNERKEKEGGGRFAKRKKVDRREIKKSDAPRCKRLYVRAYRLLLRSSNRDERERSL